MIPRRLLFRTRDVWHRKALGLFEATFAEEQRDVMRFGRSGLRPDRWEAALLAVWEGAADDWVPTVVSHLPKGAARDLNLFGRIVDIVVGKAAAIVETTEAALTAGIQDAYLNAAVRAELMAATESVSAIAFAQSEVAKSRVEPLQKIWVTVGDNRVRSTHVTAAGQVRDIDEPFDVGGAALAFPGDPAGPLGETIRCRCWEEYQS